MKRAATGSKSMTTADWWARDDLRYENGRLIFAGEDAAALAGRYHRPLFVYGTDRIRANLARLRAALVATGCDHRIYYAMKCNRHTPLLRMLAREKIGVDICSPDEMDLALDCDFAAADISFTGTGVSNSDLDRLLAQPDLHINCDSLSQIRRIGERAPGRTIGIRVNPGFGTGYDDNARLTYAGTRTTKFGIYREQWAEALALAADHDLNVTTLHFHVGCGYLSRQLDAWEQAVGAAAAFLDDMPDVTTVNLGGGLGLPHRAGEAPLDLDRWAAIVARHFGAKRTNGRDLTIATEPGDYLVKDAGLLLLSVVGAERKRETMFVSVDGGFNLHPEPAHYDLPCEPVACVPREADRARWQPVTVAGNINEALDLWAENHAMPPLEEGDRIALINAGGYGAAMASNHCMRGAFTELLI
jgi:diaminopimelate decarboxylase